MAKRMHDTEIWSKQWFRGLSCEGKLLWMYLKDKCNCAGIAEIDDIEQIEFFIGKKVSEKTFNEISKQFKRVDSKRILLIDFIDFQYGELVPSHKMRKKVFGELAKFSILYPIDRVSENEDGVKDKDKDKDKDKEEKSAEKRNIDIPVNNLDVHVINNDAYAMPWETETFKATWERWKKYKKEQHSFRYKSEDSEQTALNKLKNDFQTELRATSAIEFSIANGYKGIFENTKQTAIQQQPAVSPSYHKPWSGKFHGEDE